MLSAAVLRGALNSLRSVNPHTARLGCGFAPASSGVGAQGIRPVGTALLGTHTVVFAVNNVSPLDKATRKRRTRSGSMTGYIYDVILSAVFEALRVAT